MPLILHTYCGNYKKLFIKVSDPMKDRNNAVSRWKTLIKNLEKLINFIEQLYASFSFWW